VIKNGFWENDSDLRVLAWRLAKSNKKAFWEKYKKWEGHDIFILAFDTRGLAQPYRFRR
jgi:hypothetical protein